MVSEAGSSGYNVNESVYCRSCDTYKCKKVALPFVLRYLTNELSAMNIKLNFNLDTDMVKPVIETKA